MKTTETMTKRTPEQIEQDILRIEEVTNETTDRIDRQETFKEICQNVKYVNSEILFDAIIFQATVYENLSKKYYKFEIEDIKNGKSGISWNLTASDHAKFAKELRDMMTQVIRTQKSENRMIQANTKKGI